MFELKKGIVKRECEVTKGYQVVEVEYEDKDVSLAVNFLDINKKVTVGQEVLVNITARKLKLGSGGYDYILPTNSFCNHSKGHIMKLRYTPLQFSVLTEEEKNPELFNRIPNFNDLIIVVCELHSMLMPICLYLKECDRNIRISVIINDWGMLNAKLSHNLSFLKENHFVDYVISCQEAFNGDFECINEINSLIFSKSLDAQVTIISPLPGIVGTGTKFGFSAYKAVNVIEDISRFGGKVVFPIRVSKSEERERHKFVSHHSLTILSYVNSSVEIPIYQFEDKIFYTQVFKILNNYRTKHILIPIDRIDDNIVEKYKLLLKTMGRGFEEDSEYFLQLFATAEYILKKLRRR
ncbi:DUF3866 family protein [Caldicellulosiruptor naganoensis]|uniref:DUF3866 family protein n=1 Tax=Caldicellulosiruptor naganoensis TaxID=29324 RepID=A0ABY7BE37_9FIRM|nr:DUF3866 family protein [Caldicellulosiruptor naganoensis]WAM30622.1 DUF3866 family protein [Caldicellulosiruptor naganoensis]